jgi:hypothetical protein
MEHDVGSIGTFSILANSHEIGTPSCRAQAHGTRKHGQADRGWMVIKPSCFALSDLGSGWRISEAKPLRERQIKTSMVGPGDGPQVSTFNNLP